MRRRSSSSSRVKKAQRLPRSSVRLASIDRHMMRASSRDSQATYFNWKKKCVGMLPANMKRLRELEDENSRLKKIVADLALDKEMLQDVMKRKL